MLNIHVLTNIVYTNVNEKEVYGQIFENKVLLNLLHAPPRILDFVGVTAVQPARNEIYTEVTTAGSRRKKVCLQRFIFTKAAGNSPGFLFLHEQNEINMADLTQEEWATQLENDKDAFLLDVRTPEEVEEGYIPGATSIDIYLGQEFLDEVEKLDKDKNYYIYCRTGNRSGQACAIMNGLGFANTYNLLGGINEWEGDIVE